MRPLSSLKGKVLFLLFLMCISTSVSAQYDMQWIFGYGQDRDLKFGFTLMDFNEGELEVDYYGPALNSNFSLSFAGSFICDTTGHWSLMSNHCKIYDRAYEAISGEHIITPTGLSDNCIRDGGVDGRNYGSYQSFIFLPDLEAPSKTYALHKDMHIDFENQDLYTENFWFSTITKEDSTYGFDKKYTINDSRLFVQSLTAIPNKEKNGWWVLMPHQNSNAFDRYLARADTVVRLDTQRIGLPYYISEIDIGQSAFSPKGNYFAKNTEAHGVLLYAFDTQTGRLSDFRTIPYPDSQNVAKGLCFSPNERFIYVTTAENVYQIDLAQDDEVIHLGYFRSFDEFGWPVGLGMIFPGPDCKLYVSPGSSTYFLHAILSPNEKGADCQFVERAIELPTSVPHHLPNIPQYRYLNGCDSTIYYPFTTSTDPLPGRNQKRMDIYPNPVLSEVHLLFPSVEQHKQLIILNTDGQKVQDIHLTRGSNETSVDVSDLPAGVYWISDPEGIFETIRMVKM